MHQKEHKKYYTLRTNVIITIIWWSISAYRPRWLAGRLIYRARVSSMLQYHQTKKQKNKYSLIYISIYRLIWLLIKQKNKKNNNIPWTKRITISLPFISREETESPRWRKHDESNINIAQNWEFIGFLDKPVSSFWESDLPIGRILNPFDLKLHSPHI